MGNDKKKKNKGAPKTRQDFDNAFTNGELEGLFSQMSDHEGKMFDKKADQGLFGGIRNSHQREDPWANGFFRSPDERQANIDSRQGNFTGNAAYQSGVSAVAARKAEQEAKNQTLYGGPNQGFDANRDFSEGINPAYLPLIEAGDMSRELGLDASNAYNGGDHDRVRELVGHLDPNNQPQQEQTAPLNNGSIDPVVHPDPFVEQPAATQHNLLTGEPMGSSSPTSSQDVVAGIMSGEVDPSQLDVLVSSGQMSPEEADAIEQQAPKPTPQMHFDRLEPEQQQQVSSVVEERVPSYVEQLGDFYKAPFTSDDETGVEGMVPRLKALFSTLKGNMSDFYGPMLNGPTGDSATARSDEQVRQQRLEQELKKLGVL